MGGIRRWVGGGMALVCMAACQTPATLEGPEGFYHVKQGWSIGWPVPPGEQTRWKKVTVPESILAYRRVAPGAEAWMTLSSRCGVSLAKPRLLASHLRIGTPNYTVRESAAVESAGLEGWQQVFDAQEGAAMVRVKTVTFVNDPCAFDWVLSVPGGRSFAEAVVLFDAWWQSFALDPASAEGAPQS